MRYIVNSANHFRVEAGVIERMCGQPAVLRSPSSKKGQDGEFEESESLSSSQGTSLIDEEVNKLSMGSHTVNSLSDITEEELQFEPGSG